MLVILEGHESDRVSGFRYGYFSFTNSPHPHITELQDSDGFTEGNLIGEIIGCMDSIEKGLVIDYDSLVELIKPLLPLHTLISIRPALHSFINQVNNWVSNNCSGEAPVIDEKLIEELILNPVSHSGTNVIWEPPSLLTSNQVTGPTL